MPLKSITSVGEILFDVYGDRKELGGAPFNFIYHVFKLTSNGNFITKVGGDALGKEVLTFLSEKSFPTGYIQTSEQHKTGVVIVELDDNKIPEFNIREDCAYDYIEYNKQIEYLLLSETDLLYFGTLAQRFPVSRNTIETMAKKCRRCFFDINLRQNFFNKSIIENSLKNSNVVKMNSDELRIVNTLLFDDNQGDMLYAANRIIEKCNIDLLSITLGAEGAVLFSPGEHNRCAAKADNIVNTVGAGDAYSAILALGYLNNLKISDINKLACEFAARICTVAGAVPDNDNFYDNYKRIFTDHA